MQTTWAVVELAGYVGENVRRSGLTSYGEADKAARALYPDADEREALHVDIAREEPDGLSYDY